MPVYEYRCPRCGPFEVGQAMGTAAPSRPCAACGADATRRYSPPNVNRTPAALAAALVQAEKSRDEPEVVTSIPGRGAPRSTPQGPRLRHLPRL